MNFDPVHGQTPLDPDEAEGLVPALSTQQELNQFEAQNILEALLWARSSRAIRKQLLSVDTLKQLHRRMFDQTWKWAGRFRLTQKSIGVEAYRISTELTNLVEDVKVWIEFATYSTEEIAVRFHHRLVQIHPFPNGNGRHARLATDLLCEQLSIPLFTWGSGDLIRDSDVRRSYIQALQSADAHDYSLLMAFVRS